MRRQRNPCRGAEAERRAAEEELRRAKELAEQAAVAKSRFLANMSHEIRTPLNGVLGMLDFLKQSELAVQQAEMAQIAHDSATSLLGIIEDVLDFSKIEAGMLDIERSAFSIVDVVERACALLNPGAAQKDVELLLFTDPRLPAMAMGDPTRVAQILHNIIGNAIKFTSRRTPPRQVRVRAEVAETRDTGVGVRFSVSDNGIGMDEVMLGRLFRAFTQADASITRRFGGTGLGLSISQNLTRLMGGRIEVESRLNEGSTFTVTLPFDLAPAMDAAAAPAIEPRLEGVSCVIAGSDQLSQDLRVYLEAAGATVDSMSQEAAQETLQTALQNASDRRVFVLDSPPCAANPSEGDPQAPRVIRLRRSRRRAGEALPPPHELESSVLKRVVFLSRVALAAGRAVSDARTATGETRRPQLPDSTPAPRRRLLVAEDNELNQMVVRQQLLALGYDADVVADGREALERWRGGDYALVITDLQMPEMDGYELTDAIRRIEEREGRARMPIVALTANAQKEEIQACRRAGMDDYMTKPMSLDGMRAVIERCLVPAPQSDLEPAGNAR